MTWNHHHSRRVEFGIAASLTVVLVGLHLTVLTHAGALWRDEISSLRLATMPTLSGFWSSLALDPFPALYFLLLRLWNAIGLARIDFDLRLLGCLIGLLLIATLWWCCWRINRRAPIWPLVLFALNPVVIQFGDSLRAYGVGVIFIAVAFASIWKLTFRKNGIGSFAVAIAAALLSVQTLFTNALLLFAISFGALIVCIRRRLWWRAAAIFSVGLIAATSLLVYLPIFRRTREWSSLLVMPTRFSYVFAKYWQALAEGSSVVPYLWLCSMLVAAIVAILSQFGSRLKGFPDTDRDKILFSGVTLGTATFGTIIFFKVVSWPTSLWYFLPLMALSALCLHVIYSTLFENVRVRFVGWVAVLGVAGISILPAQRHSLIHLTNADLMAQAVASQAGKEDLVLVSPYFYAISFQRYYHGAAPWTAVPTVDDYSLHRWDLLKQAMEERDPIRATLERVQTTLQKGHKIFLVGAFPYRGPKAPVPLAPAPQTPEGWWLQGYLHNWAAQTSFLIYQHAEHSRLFIVNDPAPVSGMEHLLVFEVSGWKSEPVASAH